MSFKEINTQRTFRKLQLLEIAKTMAPQLCQENYADMMAPFKSIILHVAMANNGNYFEAMKEFRI